MSTGVSVGQLMAMDTERRTEVIAGLGVGARQKLAHLAALSVQSSAEKAQKHLGNGHTAWVGEMLDRAHRAAVVATELTAEETRCDLSRGICLNYLNDQGVTP
jgi:hypothetical protein